MRSNIFLLAVVVALGVACGDSTGPNAVAGTYTLQRVDGSDLPYTTAGFVGEQTIDGQRLYVETFYEVVGASLQLKRDRTFVATHEYRIKEVRYDYFTGDEVDTVITAPTFSESGTYTVNGASLELTSSDGVVESASIVGDVLTVMSGGVAWVYER